MNRPHDQSLRYIIPIVLVAHACMMLGMKFNSDKMPPYKPKEHLIVKTVQLDSPTKTSVVRTANQPKPEPVPPPVEIAPPEEIAAEPEPLPTLPEPEPTPPPPAPEPPKPEPKKETKKSEPTKPKEKKEPKPEPKKETAKKEPAKKPVAKTEKKPEKKKSDTAKKETKKETKKTVAEAEPKKKTQSEKKDKPSKPKTETKAKAESDSKPKTSEVAKPDPKVEAAKAEAKAKQLEKIRSAKESIAKIDANPHKLTSSSSSESEKRIAPVRIEKLEIEALPTGGGKTTNLTPKETGYVDELVQRLKLQLRLPEFGEVKIKLTLERSGKVAKLEIVSSESQANRKYIQDKLPTINIPGYGDNFSGQSQYTFSISLSNDV